MLLIRGFNRSEEVMAGKVHATRLRRLKEGMRRYEFNGVIIVPGPNMKYYTGVGSLLLERPFLLFVPVEGEPHLVCPRLEAEQYRGVEPRIIIHEWDDSEGPSVGFDKLLSSLEFSGKWGVEGRVPFHFLYHLTKRVSVELDNAEPLLQKIREVKDEEEVKLLKEAARILSKSYLKIPELLEDGLSELQLARKISDLIYSNGAEKVEDLLVQSGARSAIPHALPSEKKIRRGESIVIDISSTFSGYYADITRTFMIGSNREFDNVYSHVLEAQERAIEVANEGAEVGSIDLAARDYLKSVRLSNYFTHRTGHGLGLEVHEAPYIVPGGKEKIRANMFFTIEPGVYMPSKFGVRIEDNLMGKSGMAEIITKLPKELGWWK